VKSSAKKNLTLSLPAELIRAAKVLAAKKGTSMNDLVKKGLEKMVGSDDEYTAALGRILATSEKGLYRTKKARIARSELYD
jgi:plasmid stability protein